MRVNQRFKVLMLGLVPSLVTVGLLGCGSGNTSSNAPNPDRVNVSLKIGVQQSSFGTVLVPIQADTAFQIELTTPSESVPRLSRVLSVFDSTQTFAVAFDNVPVGSITLRCLTLIGGTPVPNLNTTPLATQIQVGTNQFQINCLANLPPTPPPTPIPSPSPSPTPTPTPSPSPIPTPTPRPNPPRPSPEPSPEPTFTPRPSPAPTSTPGP